MDFKRRWGTHENEIRYFDHCKRGNSSILMKIKSNLPGVIKKIRGAVVGAAAKANSHLSQ
jgi:hypothetical protein